MATLIGVRADQRPTVLLATQKHSNISDARTNNNKMPMESDQNNTLRRSGSESYSMNSSVELTFRCNPLIYAILSFGLTLKLLHNRLQAIETLIIPHSVPETQSVSPTTRKRNQLPINTSAIMIMNVKIHRRYVIDKA